MAWIGYSCGAELAVQVAAHARQWGLPAAKAILCVYPYTGAVPMDTSSAPLADLGGIPPETLVVVMVGNPDSLVGDAGGRAIYGRLSSVPPANKNYVIISSDNHGWPALIADHVGPVALDTTPPAEDSWDMLLRSVIPTAGWGWTDAVDFYGYWKIFDGLRDAAFRGTHRQYALGDTPEQRFMGTWSDGIPVKPLVVLSQP
jgi:dienelactone hydrolase